MIVPKYYEDLEHLHVNTMPNRAYYIPASKRMDCLVDNREASDRFVLLSGEWKFSYFDSIYEVKDAFYEEGYDTSAFEKVQVPGVWQNYGHDRHQYTNTRYPFPMDPPYVPHENPCGAYVKKFTYRKDPEAPVACLNFEGVDSCFYVWMNGSFVGYSQVSHSTSEFDVTELVKDGVNTLAVLVLKWCDGSYMEDQDKFRMSGIFRDVYLLKRSEKGIRDYFVTAAPTNDYRDGRVEIRFSWQKEEPTDATAELWTAKGTKISEIAVEDGKAVLEVPDAHLWNAEDPYLYTLVLKTEHEVITDHVGIREIHVKDGIVYINGVKVKFHGTNRHDSDPKTGFVISREQMMKDLIVMKQHNINAIRTSHYPNAPAYYQFYDRLGFYVIDEADNESHGTANVYQTETDWESFVKRWNEAIADNPAFTAATVDRTQRCVERDKNRPSVVIWSMGNECAYGCTFEEALAWTKAFDSTRLTHYEGARYISDKRKYDYSNLDLYSRMYPSLAEIRQYFEEDGTKPFIMCEYCHAMGNGPGDLEDYFEIIHTYDGSCGAFVWEWCDHVIDMGTTIEGKKIYAYGGDHREYPHDGNFCMDGLVYPDRTPHTGLLEFKNVYRPARVVSFDQDRQEIVLRNYLDFTNLKNYLTIRYEVLVDGMVREQGVIDDPAVLDLEAHQKGCVPIPFQVPEKGKCHLLVTYLLKEEGQVLPAGYELGFEEIPVKTAENVNQKAKELLSCKKCKVNFEFEEDDRTLTVSTPAFCYTYDKLTGLFSEMVYENQKILERPMEYQIWRAPTDNDRNIRNVWQDAKYDRIVTRAYETNTTVSDNGVQIESILSVSAIYIQRILNIKAVWIIRPDGAVDVTLQVQKNPIFPMLPRFGLRMFLPKGLGKVNYCGLGPNESYIDKQRSSYHGVFHTTVKALHEDYIRPQENGSHYDCDYVTVYGDRLALMAVGEETFSFNASVYTAEELTSKAHNYELVESPYTVFCVDYRQNGIGSNSCGPELLEKYCFDEKEFTFNIRLKPVRL
ncbi:MAG: DUF4981 domain-containing protein [Fusicatenibacter sp.]|nr:DUF4981 domain-containing protein [Fusicatenibacter sp.]